MPATVITIRCGSEEMWKILTAVLSVEFIYLNMCQSKDLNEEIRKCHFGDTSCLMGTMNGIIRRYPKGIPSLGMKPIDVVDINNTELLNQAEIGGIRFQFKMYDQVNYGFENTTITKLIGFGKDPTATYMEIHGNIPSLVHKGRYLANGQISYIHVNASGESISDFQNFRFKLKLKVLMEYRNNKRYIKIYELVPRVNLDRWIVWLDDFFHENSDLTTAVNKVINANWVEFWNELEPGILEIFRDVFTHLVGDVFQKIPYDDLFLEDDEKPKQILIKN